MIRGVAWWRWLVWICLIPWLFTTGFCEALWAHRRDFITPWPVTADHGQIVIPWRDVVPMDEMPALLARLRAEKCSTNPEETPHEDQ